MHFRYTTILLSLCVVAAAVPAVAAADDHASDIRRGGTSGHAENERRYEMRQRLQNIKARMQEHQSQEGVSAPRPGQLRREYQKAMREHSEEGQRSQYKAPDAIPIQKREAIKARMREERADRVNREVRDEFRAKVRQARERKNEQLRDLKEKRKELRERFKKLKKLDKEQIKKRLNKDMLTKRVAIVSKRVQAALARYEHIIDLLQKRIDRMAEKGSDVTKAQAALDQARDLLAKTKTQAQELKEQVLTRIADGQPVTAQEVRRTAKDIRTRLKALRGALKEVIAELRDILKNQNQ